MPHLGVQHGEEAEQKVAANHVREVEGEIPPETFFCKNMKKKPTSTHFIAKLLKSIPVIGDADPDVLDKEIRIWILGEKNEPRHSDPSNHFFALLKTIDLALLGRYIKYLVFRTLLSLSLLLIVCFFYPILISDRGMGVESTHLL